uniref:PI-PLC Y-box domain-containing protein n=1 Tax=Davidia involucrata TaxID=16924 RepID=A0A5B7BCY3_DAVIN
MKRSLLRNVSIYTRSLLLSPPTIKPIPNLNAPLLSLSSTSSKVRLFSSENDSSNGNPKPLPETSLAELQKKDVSIDVEDVSNKELKALIEKYFKGDEEVLPSVLDAILRRKLTGKHEDTDDELMDWMQFKPLDDVKDKEFESDFEEAHETDEEIEDLYNARDIVMKRMVKDEYFNMDEKKWEEMIKEATEHGYLKDTKECEEILEDMLSWDKLLPDKIKQRVEEKFNEIGDMVERGELEPEEGYELFKEFEDKMVIECAKLMEAEGPPQFEDAVPDKKKDTDDPPGEGPILRWQTRVVFAPGGDAWHPKDRKVKLAVTLKELGLSKHQFRRLRELVGKRYNPGKDELTITSERFEHREENRKDCLRTLFSLIEEAGKANKLVEEARTSYVKERLRANPEFMERLRSKTMRIKASNSLPA